MLLTISALVWRPPARRRAGGGLVGCPKEALLSCRSPIVLCGLAVTLFLALPDLTSAEISILSFTGPDKVAPGEMAEGQIVLSEPVKAALLLTVQWRDTYGRIGAAVR